MILLFAAGTAWGFQAAGSSSSAQHELSLRQYIAEIETDSSVAKRLKDHPDEVALLQKKVPTEWVVAAGGQTFTVPADWLRERIGALESDPSRAAAISREIAARLDAMKVGAEQIRATQPIDPDAAKRTLSEILARREYRGVVGTGPLQSWWERATNWISEKLEALFERASRHAGLSTTLIWLAVSLVALFLLGWLIRSVLSIPNRTRFRLEGPPVPQTGDLARQALAQADREDYSEAIHLVYKLALARLEDNGLWNPDPSRTPREYLHLLPRDHVWQPPLAALTTRFEHAWYAGKQMSAEDFRGALTELGGLGCHLEWSRATASSF